MGKFYRKLEDGTMEEVEAFSQIEVDGIFKGRLERETKKIADDHAELKEKLAEVNKSVETAQAEKKTLEESLQSKDKEVQAAKLEATRVGIKHEFGLSDDLQKFLIGDTEEDIRKNAELLKKGGAAAGVHIEKDDKGNGPAESASKKLAGNLFKSQGE